MSNVLEINNLSKSYAKFTLDNVSFNIEQGSITGLVGPNGAGKTTIIKSILNMIRYDHGDIKIFDKSHKKQNADDIGVVMDNSLYEEEWSIKDLEKALSPFYASWDKAKFRILLAKFGLELDHLIKELSFGMNVKLMIAVALSHGAKFLILDEPTSGLDPVSRDELCDILRDCVEENGCTIFFSTHITADLEKIADKVVFVLNGKIEFFKKTQDLLAEYKFVRGSTEITEVERSVIIGYKENRSQFEGIVKVADVEKLRSQMEIFDSTLDDILVCINRGERQSL